MAVTSLAAIFLARPNPRHNFKKGTEWGKLKTWWDMDAFRCPSFLWFTASVCAIFFAFYAVFFNLEEWSVTAGVGIRSNEKAGKGQLQTYYLLVSMSRVQWLTTTLIINPGNHEWNIDHRAAQFLIPQRSFRRFECALRGHIDFSTSLLLALDVCEYSASCFGVRCPLRCLFWQCDWTSASVDEPNFGQGQWPRGWS